MGQKYFADGDLVIFYTNDGQSFMKKIESGKEFHSHYGYVCYDELIGKPAGITVTTNTGKKLYACNPTFNEFIQKMPRRTNIIHKKDLGLILLWADIFPGARVMEGGSGSGALLMTLSRAVGRNGHVYSYDVRPELQETAKRNCSAYLESTENITFKKGNLYEEIDETEIDRIILDVPEPWRVIPQAQKALVSGGLILAYLPTIIQAIQFSGELESNEHFLFLGVEELILRPWQIKDKSVRPNQRIIGHTGFLVLGRKVNTLAG